MKKYNKAMVTGLSAFLIFGNILYSNAATYPDTNQKSPKCHGFCAKKPMLKESVDQLQKGGVLSEDDVKNIEIFINKERELMEKDMRSKVYKEECSKIDKMVSEKVITKDQGDKLKAAVKENLETCK